MNLAQRASSLVFPGFWFGTTDPGDAEKLVDLSVGGFCLYGGSRDEVFRLVTRLQARARNPLLFCADYEDGVGAWVPGGTRFPSNMAVAAAGSEAMARWKGAMTGVESRALGVDWVLAPVVDLATRPENPIVNLRAFGADPDAVIRYAQAYLKGLRAAGALPCAKHFPGHGETAVDSHLQLPDLEVPLETLMRREVKPYLALRESAGSVMVAHLRVQALDPERPATLSQAVGALLREQIGFRGLVSTDALSMRAIGEAYPEEQQAALALEAGADVLLVPRDPFAFQRAALRAVNSRPELEPLVAAASERILEVKKALGLFASRGKLDPKGLAMVGAAAHREAARQMAEAALAWARPRRARSQSNGRPLLGNAAAYFEPEHPPAQWEGEAFLAALREAGIAVAPYQEGRKTGRLIVAVFSRPQAYSGKIGLSGAEAARVQAAVGSAAEAWAVSFGTPFAVDQLPPQVPALCAFSPLEDSQRAAAQVLLGRLEAKGTLPVPLLTPRGSRRGEGSSSL